MVSTYLSVGFLIDTDDHSDESDNSDDDSEHISVCWLPGYKEWADDLILWKGWFAFFEKDDDNDDRIICFLKRMMISYFESPTSECSHKWKASIAKDMQPLMFAKYPDIL